MQSRYLRFDIDLLARRTAGVLDWIALQPFAYGLPTGLFGSNTGAAAALMAAAELPETVGAVVSRGGRPDLAGRALPQVEAPTLLIVGGDDETVIDLNEQALSQMDASLETRLVIVPGASHLFEEAGPLDAVAAAAIDWFAGHLTGAVTR